MVIKFWVGPVSSLDQRLREVVVSYTLSKYAGTGEILGRHYLAGTNLLGIVQSSDVSTRNLINIANSEMEL